MREIERKILEIDKKTLIQRLIKFKAKKEFEGLIRVKYFDFSDHRIRAKKDLLRLREIAPKNKKSFCELVYKAYRGVKRGCKYFDELEFVLYENGAFLKTSELLYKLGFKQTVYYEKIRTFFSYRNAKIEIDEHPKIPAFAEIEAKSPPVIEKLIKKLGLGKYEQSAESIGELLARKYPQVKLNGLKF